MDTIKENYKSLTYTWTNVNVHTRNINNIRTAYDTLMTCFKAKSSFKESQGKQLLKNVSGLAQPGELLAVMGSSGAGKTTLLNFLTFRNARNLTETGIRAINNVSIDSEWLTAVSAYVQQRDLFMGTLTVWEHLIFQALVRMDRRTPYTERIARVEEVMKEMLLTKCKNTVIGVTGQMKGLSGGEMKRLSFASEILTDPPLIICDEPTSGLDSFMARKVINILQTMALKGKTIICTIHQPSSEVYHMFDKILLLANGRTAFLGAPNEAIEFFNRLGVCFPNNYNPADFFVQLLAIVPTRELSSYETINTICEEYKNSPYNKYCTMNHQNMNLYPTKELSVDCSRRCSNGPYNISSLYNASWTEQFSAVFWRSWLNVKKEPALIKSRIFETMIKAALVSTIFYNERFDQDGVIIINGALYFCMSMMTYPNIFIVINEFCSELPVFIADHRNGLYRTDVYFLSRTLAEVPIFLMIPILFTSIVYYMIGLNPKFEHFLTAMLFMTLVTQVAVSVGYFVSCASIDIKVAFFVGKWFMVPFQMCSGFFLNVSSIPYYFRWFSIFSWCKYTYEGLRINQWSDIKSIQCNKINMTMCLRSGHDVLESDDILEENITTDIISLLLLIIGFRFMAFLSLLIKTSRK